MYGPKRGILKNILWTGQTKWTLVKAVYWMQYVNAVDYRTVRSEWSIPQYNVQVMQ